MSRLNIKFNFNYHFQNIFNDLSIFFKKKLYSSKKLGKNIKSHQVYGFDIEANNIIIEYLVKNFNYPAQIISEESEKIFLGNKEPKFTFIIDPVDGSANVGRNLNIFSVGIAVLTSIKEFSIDSLVVSMVGNYLTNEFFVAQKGSNAFCNNEPISTSKNTDPETFVFNFELNHLLKGQFQELFDITPQIHQVRSLGSALTALSLVASGRLDAHIDVRNRLTIENILPASLLILEAGGIITDDHGDSLKLTNNLEEPFNIIASGNSKIHNWILNKIN